jgi:dTDP-4-dehydrorhamnose reductase
VKILVTGASGLLGANLVLQLQQQNQEVVAIYRRHRLEGPGVKSVQADLTNPIVVEDLLQQFRPNWIIHCAAITNVDWCQANPADAARAHVEMSRGLAVGARKLKARLIYISTDSVFDGTNAPYSEQDLPAPGNIYAQTKLAGERAVQEELTPSLIIRTNIYGWNMQQKQSLAEWILNRLASGETLPGFDDVIFTPILVNDLNQVIVEMIERQLTGLYHVAGSESCSKYEFALRLADTFNLDNHQIRAASIADAPLKAPRPLNTALKTGKISRILGRSMPDVNAGLRRFRKLRDSGFITQLRALKGT